MAIVQQVTKREEKDDESVDTNQKALIESFKNINFNLDSQHRSTTTKMLKSGFYYYVDLSMILIVINYRGKLL